MSSVQDLILLQQYKQQQKQQNNPLYALMRGVAQGIQEEQQRRQQLEMKKQELAENLKMLEALKGEDSNTSSGKTGSLVSNPRGDYNISKPVPKRSYGINEQGEFTYDIGYRQPTPAEEKSRYDLQSSIQDRELAGGKRQLIDDFVEGRMTRDEFINQSQNYDMGEDEFNYALKRRQMKQPITAGVNPIKNQNAIPGTDIPINSGGTVIPSGQGAIVPRGQNDAVVTEYDSTTGLPAKTISVTGKMTEDNIKHVMSDAQSIAAGKRMAMQNLMLVGGAVNEAATRGADAIAEGGAGNVVNAWWGKMANNFGGAWGDAYDDSDAMPGILVEMTARAMPLLTQQGDKPGSVRLVATVFEKLAESYFDPARGPASNAQRLGQSLRMMYRFARAAAMLGVDEDLVASASEQEREQISENIANLADRIVIDEEEEEVLGEFTRKQIQPLIDVQSGNWEDTDPYKPSGVSAKDFGYNPNEWEVVEYR